MPKEKSPTDKPSDESPADAGGETLETGASERIVLKRSPLLRVLDFLSEEQIEEIVKDALAASGRARSKSARQSLNAAINASPRIQIKGFSEASKANTSPQFPQLVEQVFDECTIGCNERLLGAVLRMWMAGRQPLRKSVENHLAGIEVEANAVDFKKAELGGLWDPRDWDAQIESLLASNGESADDSRDDEDAASDPRDWTTQLMLGLVSGAVPASPGEIKAAGLESPILLDLFDELWSAPYTNGVWRELDQAIEALEEINEQKGREIIDVVVTMRRDKIDFISSEFGQELDFFECDLAPIRELTQDLAVLLAAEEDHAGELIKLLERYQEIRPEAGTLREEKMRREERDTLEGEVATRFEQWRSELAEQEKDIRRRRDEAGDSPEAADEDEAETEAVCPDAAEPLEKQLASLRESLRDKKSKLDELQTRYDDRGKELRKWQRYKGKLDKDRQRLEEEVALLRAALEAHSNSAGQAESSAIRENREEYIVSYSAQRVDSVRDARNQAERSFPEELVFRLNAKSELDSVFEKPAEVFHVFAWLAKDYREGRRNPEMGGNRKELLEKKLKEACPNWSYTPRQSRTATGKYRDWYQTSVDGRKLDLHEHVKRGTSRDAKATIRIGFAWDDQSGKVIIGYLGRHPKTDQS